MGLFLLTCFAATLIIDSRIGIIKTALLRRGETLEFLYQPQEANRIGDVIKANLLGNWTRFRAAVAFVKKSGTKHIAKELHEFSKQGTIQIIAGIDHLGTSKEGLEQILDAISPKDELLVLHNRLAMTFHPKIYLFANEDVAEIIVGSGNLTQGGLFTNYEAAFCVRLDLTQPSDKKILNSVDVVFDSWCNPKNGICKQVDIQFLSKLVASGLVPPEALTRPESIKKNILDNEGMGVEETTLESLFSTMKAPPPPKVAQDKNSAPLKPRTPDISVSSSLAITPSGFVMTLQQTDVGTGQKTIGAAARSPEIFIPLAALRMHLAFWKFPDEFTADPNWNKKLDKEGQGKLDRPKVRMRVGGEMVDAALFYNPNKSDFRIRNSAIRDAGEIDDILRVEKVAEGLEYEYYVEIVPLGTTQHPVYLARCSNTVRNSNKRYGYY